MHGGAQPQRHALRHITTINLFFFMTYQTCTIWSEIAIRKGSTASIISNVDCSTLQTSRPNHPTTYTYTHTLKQQSVHACIHACIHSFIQSTIFTLSLFHKNGPSITTAIHQNLQFSINHQPCIARTTQYGIRACTHDVTMTRTQWNGRHTACQQPPYRRTYIHACMHRGDDFLAHTECADENLRWWWWWSYWPQSRYSS